MHRCCQALLVLVALAGCNRGISHVPVTGTVKYSDGSVPAGDVATVTFQPSDATPNTKAASGTIAKDGSFSLTTINPGDGALPGAYRVTVHVMQGYPRGRLMVANQYTKPDTTPLEATVEDGGDNQFDFVVEKP